MKNVKHSDLILSVALFSRKAFKLQGKLILENELQTRAHPLIDGVGDCWPDAVIMCCFLCRDRKSISKKFAKNKDLIEGEILKQNTLAAWSLQACGELASRS